MPDAVVVRRLVLCLIVAMCESRAAIAQNASPTESPVRAQRTVASAPGGWSMLNNDRVAWPADPDAPAGTDRPRFIYQILSGDVRIAAHADLVTSADERSNAGLMIRSSLHSGAPYASVFVNGSDGPTFRRRKQNNGVDSNAGGSPSAGAARWLALERIGSRVVAYSSSDGKKWTALGSDTIDLDETVYVGIATPIGDRDRGDPDLSQVFVSGLPARLRQRDVGGPAIRGSARQEQGAFTVTGGGDVFGETQDQFHFVYQVMQGDVDLVARIASMANANRHSKAGVMVRESLDAESRHAAVLVSGGNEYAFDRRGEIGASSEHTAGGPAARPGWVRLTRSGARFEAFRSGDGRTWTSIGSAEIEMSRQVYVGLSVTGEEAGAPTTAVLDGVSLASIAGLPNLPPTVTLVTPANGESFAAPATITLNALAADPENRLARVDFYANDTLIGTASALPYSFTWSSVPAGSYTLTAVASDADGGATTSSPVSITVQGSNEPPTVTLTSPADGATFTAPATITLTASASDPENRLARVEFYRGSSLVGTDTSSPYSFTWSSVPAGSYTLTAVAFDSDGGTTTSPPVSITVNAANQPPTVALTSPANGATFTAPATIALTASASDPENRLARVEFYRGATLLGSDATSPYSFTWSSVPAGSYTFTAVAFDADGGTTTSPAVSVTVNPAPSSQFVAFTASTDHDTNVTSYLLEIFTSGADPNTASAVASTNLGKPTPDANRDITVDETSFLNALQPGNYIATVTAIGPGGSARSTSVAYVR